MIRTNNAKTKLRKRPIHLKWYRELCFDGIPRYPNFIQQELRKRLPKFSNNNAITCEDHLRCFLDMMSNYEVELEDVILMLFV